MGIARDGKWQHLCVTWRSSDGSTSSYRNGLQIEKTTFNMGGQIVGDGNLNIGRRADMQASFCGKLSNFNIWSSYFTSQQIAAIASSCKPLSAEGDIVKWSVVKTKLTYGSVTKNCPGTCYV